MQPNNEARISAAIVTFLVISCLGILFVALDYFVLVGFERLIEFIGLLPKNFLQSRELVLPIATTVVAIPVLIYTAIIMYKCALEAELGILRANDNNH